MVMTDELFEQYKNIVYYCYNKFEKTKFIIDSEDDLVQEGFLAMINAVEMYEEYRTVALSSYIFHFVKYRMWDWIKKNSKPYSWTSEDISDLEFRSLSSIDEYDDIEEFVKVLLNDYRYYLNTYTKNKVNTNKWVDRAQMIIEEYVKNDGKISCRRLEEKFCIDRTTINKVLKHLRTVITMKTNNKLYKEGDNL